MFSKAVLETRRPWSQAFKSLLKINISILECHIQPPINQRGHRGWGGRMASSTQRTRVWTNSRRPWRTGKPGVLQSMRSQRVRLRGWTVTKGRVRTPFGEISENYFPVPFLRRLLKDVFHQMRRKTRKWKTRALRDRNLTEEAGKGHFQVCVLSRSVVSNSLWPHGP